MIREQQVKMSVVIILLRMESSIIIRADQQMQSLGAFKRLDHYENGVLSTLYIVFGIKENNPIDSNFLVFGIQI